MVAVVGVLLTYYVGLYFYADRALDRVDALVPDGPEVMAPQLQQDGVTYLLVGTGLPGRTGPAAVSTVVTHLSADGEHAVMVSVPPTALTDTPACRQDDGDVRQPRTEQFADALLDGGPSCLVRSVQQLSGLRVDHYIGIDVTRLPGLAGALGEVAACPGGKPELTGDQVGAWLAPGRTGEDVTGAEAAGRLQGVLTGALDRALAAGTMADPLTLTRFLTRATDAFTVDGDTTLADLRSLASTVGGLPAGAIESTGVPVSQVGYVPAGQDTAAVLVDGTATRALFDSVIDGGRLPEATEEAAPEAPAEGNGAAEAPAATSSAARPGAGDNLPEPTGAEPVPPGTTVTVPPAGVSVEVLDATGSGQTGPVADGLAAAGFPVTARGTEPGAVQQTLVRYGPASLEPARTVAAAVPGSVLLESDQVGSSVQLVIGADFTGLAPVAVGSPVPESAAPPAEPAPCS